MRILMLHDCGYVGLEIAKRLRELGFHVDHVLYHTKMGFGLGKVAKIVGMFLRTVGARYDFVYAHYLGVASYIAQLSGLPYVVHCHGSDVRGVTYNSMQRTVLKEADLILYSTRDLAKYLPDRAKWLPTPVGSQFKDLGLNRTIWSAGRRLWYEVPNRDFGLAIEDIDYWDMPDLLNRVDTYVDQHTFEATSKTAYEALACGCRVVSYDGSVRVGLPDRHKVNNVVSRLLGYVQDSRIMEVMSLEY